MFSKVSGVTVFLVVVLSFGGSNLCGKQCFGDIYLSMDLFAYIRTYINNIIII